MITSAELKSHTKADLAEMAKRLGIVGGSRMLKDDLVRAVLKASKQAARKAKSNGASKKRKKMQKADPVADSTSAAANPRRARAKSRTNGKAVVATASKKAARGGGKKAASSVGAAGVRSGKERVGRSAAGGKSAAAKPGTASSNRKSATGRASSAAKGMVAAKAESRSGKQSKAASGKKKKSGAGKPTSPRVQKKIRELQLKQESSKDISFRKRLVKTSSHAKPQWEPEPVRDRVALFVRDAYWLHASWDVTRPAVERAKAALAEQWHGAKPVLRIIRVEDSSTSAAAETIEREIEIHGGVRDWYIEWSGVPASLKAAVGYLATGGRFHLICESNVVRTPQAGATENVDSHWSDSGAAGEKILALSGGYDSRKETEDLKQMLEDRLKRTMGAPALAKIGAGADSPFRRRKDFHFDMQVELLLLGSTMPDAYVTLNGEPVALREDGTFVMRLPFPDRRQVLPAVACSRDGSQQRTIVVAVERNTKIMEPLDEEVDSGE